MDKAITRAKPQINLSVKEPPLYKVLYLNDNVTTVEFVIESLITVFNYSVDTATELTTVIHQDGIGTAAILPYEMAEQKGVEVTQMARADGFPLVIKLEPVK
jgi:ATP-dependent Clp protease adaptor protein ClpS